MKRYNFYPDLFPLKYLRAIAEAPAINRRELAGSGIIGAETSRPSPLTGIDDIETTFPSMLKPFPIDCMSNHTSVYPSDDNVSISNAIVARVKEAVISAGTPPDKGINPLIP